MTAQSALIRVPRLDERWLRFLVLGGDTNDAIRQQLAADALPSATDAELDQVRAQYPIPADFQPTRLGHAPSLRLICTSGTVAFFREDTRVADGALGLLRNPRARELVEAALITGVPHREIVTALSTLLKVTATVEIVEVFASALLDTACVTRAQLRLLVEERVRVGIERTIRDSWNRTLIKRAVAKDARVLAASMPRSVTTWAAVMAAMGYAPPDRDLSETLRELERYATLRAGQALMRDGRDDDRRADAFVGALGKIRAIRETATDPNEGVLRALAQLKIVQTSERMPTVRELEGEVGSLEEGPRNVYADDEERDGSEG